MKVIAKFKCSEKRLNTEGKPEDGSHVTMVPVTGGSKENENFYKWTPSGAITLGTINETAAAQFIEGEEYYVTFEKAVTLAPPMESVASAE